MLGKPQSLSEATAPRRPVVHKAPKLATDPGGKGIDMWLITDRGFYSVVDKGDREGYLCVRARVRGDIENLFKLDSLAGYAGEVIETGNSDYRFRVYVTREDWVTAASTLAAEIDYGNFKTAVGRRQGQDRADRYLDVWRDLYRLQRG
jgi:hypothetical protein